MATLRFTLVPGHPIFEQVVFAATKAFVSGKLQPGDPFPSVRGLADELKINPNTAAKVVQHLIGEGWLQAAPGKGTVVARAPKPKAAEKKHLLEGDIEQLAVEAKRLGLSFDDVVDAFAVQWKRLDETGKTDAA
jgi:GntR family transcriptional regulator